MICNVLAKAGGDEKLGIRGEAGLPPLAVGASAWRDLGVCYEILSRLDPAYLPRVAVAVTRFAENATADNPDLPAARKYLELHQGGSSPGP